VLIQEERMADKFKGADYIAVEVIRRSANKPEQLEAGLFIGIAKRANNKQEEKTFIVSMITNNSAKIYNLDEYDIVTMERHENDVKFMTIFTDTAEDQEVALEMLGDCIEDMKEANRLVVNDVYGELIDIDTYTEYPEHILQSDANAKVQRHSSTSSRSTDNVGNTTTRNTTNNNYSNTNTTKVKDPYLTHMKRKGKLPAPEKLVEIREKVIGIATGQIEPKPLPLCDYDVKESKKTPAQKAMEQQELEMGYDDFAGYPYGGW
jgi:asparagine N-glycosylation enzyme membrane subunit Stt3